MIEELTSEFGREYTASACLEREKTWLAALPSGLSRLRRLTSAERLCFRVFLSFRGSALNLGFSPNINGQLMGGRRASAHQAAQPLSELARLTHPLTLVVLTSRQNSGDLLTADSN